MKTFKTPNGTELPLMDLRGKDYLQVAHRIQWFRESHPEYAIETKIIEVTDKRCIVKAAIKRNHIDVGAPKEFITRNIDIVLSEAHGQESVGDFQDYIEKAETKAIGRALANLGFGTQFAQELDEGTRIADTPQAFKKLPDAHREMVPPIPNRAPGAMLSGSTADTSVGPGNGLTANKPQTNKWADYTLKTGKTKGQTIKSIGIDGAMRYREWLEGRDTPPKGAAKDDLSAIIGFQQECADANQPKVWNGNPSPETTEYTESNWRDEEMPKFDSDEKIPF